MNSYLIHPGYIDLSKRRVSPEDITKCEERYMKSKAVASILRHVAQKLPSVDADPKSPVEQESAATKKSRRAARKAGEEDDLDPSAGMPIFGANEEEKLEMLYEKVAWPLGKTYGHPYDAFKLALTYVSQFPGPWAGSDGLLQ